MMLALSFYLKTVKQKCLSAVRGFQQIKGNCKASASDFASSNSGYDKDSQAFIPTPEEEKAEQIFPPKHRQKPGNFKDTWY